MCRTSKTDLVRSIGADDVIDHTREDFTDQVGHYDLILDPTSTHTLARLRRALTPRGTLVMVGGAEGGRRLHGTDRLIRAMLLSPFVGQHLRGVLTTAPAKDLHTLTELIDAGTVTPILDSTYPLVRSPTRSAI
ncbi:zinc-binding dehydrogenase [Nonomuraea turcica]|uniref:zinc-binding dehydrogenase n=1 Tax=Nonomuraea sp. G32 TaxID=3067274 RepID=UPI00273B5BF6|nr:zinc-binding dehydrogenase [Nonomuraea sp. G32]MDP4511997.1 zinc-binding dehydrogenase [Nonomuraea sp. G32]